MMSSGQHYSPQVLCFCLEYQLSYLHLFSSKDFLFLEWEELTDKLPAHEGMSISNSSVDT